LSKQERQWQCHKTFVKAFGQNLTKFCQFFAALGKVCKNQPIFAEFYKSLWQYLAKIFQTSAEINKILQSLKKHNKVL
jgi:hypothetical protein